MPDRVAMRDALRSVRYVLRRVSSSLHNIAPPPGPGGVLAQRAAQEMGLLTARVDQAASELARTLLIGPRLRPADLHVDLNASTRSAQFALALYKAVQSFFRRFDIDNQLVSELVARECFERVLSLRPAGASMFGALLVHELLKANVVFGEEPQAIDMEPTTARPLAIFSAILWLLSERQADEDEQALLAAQDITAAMQAEIIVAITTRHMDRLAEMFDDLAPHI
jgi:hypothetical protein